MPKKVCVIFSSLLVAAVLYYCATWPIAATDTDLWYHLNGGRYFFQTGSIASSSFFSFIEPQRVWVNYYWFFQVVVYQIFSWCGYVGLIYFRTLLSCATLLAILLYLYKNQKENDVLLYLTLLFVFYMLLLLPRSLSVRPHLFSYLFIVSFLYILEFKPPGLRWLLIPLAVLWSNLHGVEYPVMLLILGAYLTEFVYELIRGEGTGARRRNRYICAAILTLSAFAVLCNPRGIALLAMPFKNIGQVSRFIYELSPLSAYDFISFFGILFFLGWFAAITAFKRRSMRISHVILFLGGLALLTEAKRFVNEYALLALPMFGASIPIIPSVTRAKRLKIAATFLSAAFMIMPFVFMHYFFYDRPRYPVSARDLPEGVAQFLKRVSGSGSVMNYPDTGGYYEWELYPGYKIFMDLQVPFLFVSEDFETARNVYVDKRALRKIITRYRPDFITVPISLQGFKTLIADYPQYHLLFFDDAEVLYGDSSQKPDLISRHEIRSLDPFSLYKEPIGEKPDSRQDLHELLRLAEMYPGGGIVNAAIVALYQRQGRFRDALPHAEAIIRTYPESHLGYQLKAEILARLGACTEALSFYRRAASRSEGVMKELIEKQASACMMP